MRKLVTLLPLLALALTACGQAKGPRSSAQPAHHKLTECPPVGKKTFKKDYRSRQMETAIENGNYVMIEDDAKIILNGKLLAWPGGKGMSYAGGCSKGTLIVNVSKNSSYATFTYSWNDKGQLTVVTKSNDRAVPNQVETWDPSH